MGVFDGAAVGVAVGMGTGVEFGSTVAVDVGLGRGVLVATSIVGEFVGGTVVALESGVAVGTVVAVGVRVGSVAGALSVAGTIASLVDVCGGACVVPTQAVRISAVPNATTDITDFIFIVLQPWKLKGPHYCQIFI